MTTVSSLPGRKPGVDLCRVERDIDKQAVDRVSDICLGAPRQNDIETGDVINEYDTASIFDQPARRREPFTLELVFFRVLRIVVIPQVLQSKQPSSKNDEEHDNKRDEPLVPGPSEPLISRVSLSQRILPPCCPMPPPL